MAGTDTATPPGRASLEGEGGRSGQFQSGRRAVTGDVKAVVGWAVTGGWECGWGLVLGCGNAFRVESGPECWGGGRGPPPPFRLGTGGVLQKSPIRPWRPFGPCPVRPHWGTGWWARRIVAGACDQSVLGSYVARVAPAEQREILSTVSPRLPPHNPLRTHQCWSRRSRLSESVTGGDQGTGGGVCPPPPPGCIRREGASEAAPAAVRQAVGGGCQSGWERLLSVTKAIEAGTWRQGDGGWA